MSAKDNSAAAVIDGSRGNLKIAGRTVKKERRDDDKEYRKGQTLKRYATENKTKIMKMLDDRLKICEIHRLTGFPQSIIRTTKSKKKISRNL